MFVKGEPVQASVFLSLGVWSHKARKIGYWSGNMYSALEENPSRLAKEH